VQNKSIIKEKEHYKTKKKDLPLPLALKHTEHEQKKRSAIKANSL
jgi:hypothetical protein